MGAGGGGSGRGVSSSGGSGGSGGSGVQNNTPTPRREKGSRLERLERAEKKAWKAQVKQQDKVTNLKKQLVQARKSGDSAKFETINKQLNKAYIREGQLSSRATRITNEKNALNGD